MSTEKFAIVAKAAQSDILPVIEGLAVDQNGYFLSEDQMNNLAITLQAAEDAAPALQQANEQLAALQQQLEEATTARQTAEAALATANETISSQANRIQELEQEDAGGSETGKEGDEFQNGKTKFIDNPESVLNQLADKGI